MGLWLSVPAWDLLAAWTGRPEWWAVSFWCLVGGLVAAMPAVATGFLEYAALTGGEEAEKTADRHWMLAVAACSVFALSAYLRGGPGLPARPLWAMLSSFTGAGALAAAGWFGGELVSRHGAGRDP